jgi:hypothetical protein
MIGSAYSTSPSVQVSGGTNSIYISAASGAQGVGNMRFNTLTQKIEVFDGSNWLTLNIGSVSVGLTSDAESIIQWARQKRAEEFEYERLAKAHPAVKDLLNQIKDKEEQIKMIMTLVKNPANDGPIELMGS